MTLWRRPGAACSGSVDRPRADSREASARRVSLASPLYVLCSPGVSALAADPLSVLLLVVVAFFWGTHDAFTSFLYRALLCGQAGYSSGLQSGQGPDSGNSTAP